MLFFKNHNYQHSWQFRQIIHANPLLQDSIQWKLSKEVLKNLVLHIFSIVTHNGKMYWSAAPIKYFLKVSLQYAA